MRSLVLTVIGADRPGIVEAVSRVLSEHGANWEGSRMARLAGRFAGILAVTVLDARAAGLTLALSNLSGLKVVVEEAEDGTREASEERILLLELIGNDRPGIIREVSSLLAGRGVNVEELSTQCEAAPITGGLLFRMTARLRASKRILTEDLRRSLEQVGHDLMVEVSVEDAD